MSTLTKKKNKGLGLFSGPRTEGRKKVEGMTGKGLRKLFGGTKSSGPKRLKSGGVSGMLRKLFK